MKFSSLRRSGSAALWLILCAMAAAGAGGYYLWQLKAGQTPKPVKAWGNVDSDTSALSFRVAGHLLSLEAEEGTVVKKGTLIAALDPSDLERQREAVKARLESAEAKLEELQRGSRPQEVAAAKAKLDAAEAEAKAAESALRLAHEDEKRYSSLMKTGAVDRRTYDQIHTAWLRAQDAAKIARSGVDGAKEQYELVVAGPRQEVVDQAAAAVRALRAESEQAEQQLGYTKLYAPFDGTVLVKVARPGENLAAGSPVYTMTDLGKVWVRAYIEETDLGRVKLGQTVSVFIDSQPGRAFSGRLSFISSEAEFTPKTVQTEKERTSLVYRIKVDLDNASQVFKPGMPVTVQFSDEEGAR